jgi:UDP-glucose 4-epimerase
MKKIINKTLLITGGTGSFGNAVLKRFINSNNFNEIRIFSRDEKKQDELRHKLQSQKVKFYIGDVRDYNSVLEAVNGCHYIFHAAALKQVPSCEFFPMEATKTNVLGTYNIIRAAKSCQVEKLICLSTDKAAYPINAMGISKAMMEKVAISESRNSRTTICITRYGNVMASRGSVIPLFLDKIKCNDELTITNGDMTRFLMSLDEAVDLVLYAFENGESGDLFVHKAPASTINDLSIAIKQIFNFNKKDKIIGTRHGEKLYETLCTSEEMSKAIDEKKYYRIPSDSRDLNYNSFQTEGQLNKNIEDYNSHNTDRLSVSEIKEKLLKLEEVRSMYEEFRNK